MTEDRVPLRELSRRVDELQSLRPDPEPDPEAGRFVQRFRSARERWEWFDHAVIAGARYDRRNGDTYAAGLTFQTFTAIVPILMLSVAVLGFLLRNNTDWTQSLFEKVADQVPGGGGDVLIDALQAAQERAGAIGIASLLLVVWLGTGWISNMRVAIQRMWGQAPDEGSWIKNKLLDGVVLIGLGIAVLVSIGLSTVAGDVTEHIVIAIGMDDIPGAGIFVKVVALGAAFLADIVIFQYLMVTLARQRVSRRAVLRGAILGAVGIELLKLLGTLFIGRMIAASPAAGVFGAVIILLIWVNLICRWLLIVVCWTATSRPVLDQQLAAYQPAASDA